MAMILQDQAYFIMTKIKWYLDWNYTCLLKTKSKATTPTTTPALRLRSVQHACGFWHVDNLIEEKGSFLFRQLLLVLFWSSL